ncbi:PREDICTED: uncharacterized protein LOC106108016 [Papilio polytes]|uniref:uncharacterized protein LOC106108016 n=1 Tax=Papilio polytes TaxID=76194 RepID=UPI0006767A5F|nr:PREDICTED: uncharacterized protein LOC106108016 [Papilio polytes]
MALCEGQLDSVLPQLKREESSTSSEGPESPQKKLKLEPNGDIYGLNKVAGGLPLSVDYRSPVSHFVPPAVELYAARHKTERDISNGPKPESSSTPAKRKRGRPRIDKTSPEYLANVAARKQAKEMAAVISNRTDTGEKRKRGRPRVDKTSPEYLARKRIRELEALEKKAKREYRRRTGDSVASSSAGDSTPRVKRKYTKRTPSTKKNDSVSIYKLFSCFICKLAVLILSDKIRISNIKKHTRTKDATIVAKKLKWKWAGHTIRGEEKWSKLLMNWYTKHKKRKRGRPYTRWVDEIKAAAGSAWSRTAKNRKLWSNMEEAFVKMAHRQ